MDRNHLPWMAWLSASNEEIAAAWQEAWWIDARSHVETDRVRRRMLMEVYSIHAAMIELRNRDPARALEVAFIIARTAEHPGMMVKVGVSVIQEVTKADPTLWDAIAIEAAATPRLLHSVGEVWETDIPEALIEAYYELLWQEAEAESHALP